jgi:hypothetical protein
MAYGELVSLRIRDALGVANITERRMMGGLVFLLNGNMLVSHRTLKTGAEQLMFRPGHENEAEALTIAGTRPMIHGGRRMTGFIFIDEGDCPSSAFDRLLELSRRFVETLPAK